MKVEFGIEVCPSFMPVIGAERRRCTGACWPQGGGVRSFNGRGLKRRILTAWCAASGSQTAVSLNAASLFFKVECSPRVMFLLWTWWQRKSIFLTLCNASWWRLAQKPLLDVVASKVDSRRVEQEDVCLEQEKQKELQSACSHWLCEPRVVSLYKRVCVVAVLFETRGLLHQRLQSADEGYSGLMKEN